MVISRVGKVVTPVLHHYHKTVPFARDDGHVNRRTPFSVARINVRNIGAFRPLCRCRRGDHRIDGAGWTGNRCERSRTAHDTTGVGVCFAMSAKGGGEGKYRYGLRLRRSRGERRMRVQIQRAMEYEKRRRFGWTSFRPG
jgi:hypothetical protein